MLFSKIIDSLKKFELRAIRDVDVHDRKVQVVLAAAGITTVYAIYQMTRKRYKLPPGPRPWPIVGNLFSLEGEKKILFVKLMELAAEYGDIFTIYLGQHPVIILNSPDAVREAFLDNDHDYLNRPPSFSADLFETENSASIVFNDGTPVWNLQRKIAHAALRKFASGAHLEKMLQNRSADIVDLMLEEAGKPFDPLNYMTLLIYNTIGSMVFGKTFEIDDEWYVKMVEDSYKVDEILNTGFLADIFPLLGYLPNSSADFIRNNVKHFEKFVLQNMQEHRDNFDRADISDFIYYLLEAERQAREDPSEDKDALRLLTDRHFLGILTNIFLAGVDTSRLSLHWVMAFCVQYPVVQAKIHQEIDDVIGPNGVIKLSDKDRLPYTQAVLYETLRMRPIVPLAVPHATSRDTKLRDYSIPKGTQVWPNIWALHMNPALWKEPETFNPERWLDEEGKRRHHPYQFLPFSTGRRVCVGESFAKLELHMYIAMLFQKLQFQPPPGEEFSFKVDMLPGSAALLAEPFNVVATQRS